MKLGRKENHLERVTYTLPQWLNWAWLREVWGENGCAPENIFHRWFLFKPWHISRLSKGIASLICPPSLTLGTAYTLLPHLEVSISLNNKQGGMYNTIISVVLVNFQSLEILVIREGIFGRHQIYLEQCFSTFSTKILLRSKWKPYLWESKNIIQSALSLLQNFFQVYFFSWKFMWSLHFAPNIPVFILLPISVVFALKKKKLTEALLKNNHFKA